MSAYLRRRSGQIDDLGRTFHRLNGTEADAPESVRLDQGLQNVTQRDRLGKVNPVGSQTNAGENNLSMAGLDQTAGLKQNGLKRSAPKGPLANGTMQ